MNANRRYAIGLGRAVAGATLFGFPLLMTEEMWDAGFALDRTRLLVFVVGILPVLVGLSYFAGFERTFSLREEFMDALAAVAVGFATSAALLTLFGILTTAMPVGQWMGTVAVQTVPAAIGALLARKQLGADDHDAQARVRKHSYFGQSFVMLAGALFLAFNVAPTDEMTQIACKMTPWHALLLVAVSIAGMHGLMYAVGFPGQRRRHGDAPFGARFVRSTIAGYGIALLVSVFILWVFGRTDAAGWSHVVLQTVILAFPAGLGAASARVIV